MIKLEKCKVIDSTRQFIIECTKRLENFPKKEIEISSKIKKNSYDMLEIAYYANSIEDIQNKVVQINLLLAKAKVIDFILIMHFLESFFYCKFIIVFNNVTLTITNTFC